ncbi:MAG: CHAT domain-containing protein, partial [Alphaproteobacteria bacterium]|nr:CHAT domain-containing protein [Alphaproteobacteria bacterium]
PRAQISAWRARADLLSTQGRLAEAEPYRRSAIRTLLELGRRAPDGALENARIALARDLTAMGRTAEAEAELVIAIRSLQSRPERTLGVVGSQVSAIQGLAAVFAGYGRFADAETAARRAIALWREAGSAAAGTSLLPLAQALAAQYRWTEALAEYDLAARTLRNEADIRRRTLESDPSYVLALAMGGRARQAEAAATAGLAERTRILGEGGAMSALELRGLRGLALAALRRHGEAWTEFEAARALFESAPDAEGEDELAPSARERRIALMLDAYLDTARLVLPQNAETLDRLFALSQRTGGRGVQRALSVAAAQAAAGEPALAELVRQDQDARRRLVALERSAVAAAAANEAQVLAEIRADIGRLRQARARIGDEIGRRFPNYHELVEPLPLSIARARAALRDDEALIVFDVGEARTLGWAIPKRGEAVLRHIALGRTELEREVAGLRAGLETKGPELSQVPPFDVAASHRLYRQLLAPLESGWQHARKLIIVAEGALGQLPAALLVTAAVPQPRDLALPFDGYRRVPWLARRVGITVLPSVASLAVMDAVPAGAPGREPFIGFGAPEFGDRTAAQAAAGALSMRAVRVMKAGGDGARPRSADLAALPDTALELRDIARALGGNEARDVVLGPAATVDAVKRADLRNKRVLVFATHGLVPGDVEGLGEPALALTPGANDRGLLTASDVMRLKLDADWVVLSACNTAAAAGAGGEAASGLARAFLYAGARTVLVSNWPVETGAARRLTAELFRRLAADTSLGRARALRGAMLAMIDGEPALDPRSGAPAFSYAHPLFWAPFTLIGHGRGGQGPES